MYWYLAYIVVYFAFMFAMGAYYYTRVKDSSSYLIASWDTGFWSIVGALISTCCGAAVFIGWVGMGFEVGISGYLKFAFPATLFMLALFIFFAKPLRRQYLYTIADLFGERFGGQAGLMPSILSALIYSVPTSALQMVGMSTVFQLAFGMDTATGITLSFGLMLAFTVLGGLPATLVTEAIQSIILFVGIVVLLIASLIYGGGIGQIMHRIPAAYLDPAGPSGVGDVLLFALSVGPFYLIWQSMWQRIFAARTATTARNAGVTAMLLLFVITSIPYAIGIMAKTYVPADTDPDLVFSFVTTQLLPPAFGGIVLVGLLAALMTGATSFLLQGSSNLTQDIYRRLLNPAATEKSMMRVSRLTVVIIAVLALIIAYKVTDIITLYQWALRLSATMLVFPFLAVMFWRRATKTGALSSMVVAAFATLAWPYLDSGLDPAVAGFPVSLVSLVLVSLATNHSKNEQRRAVYWEDLDSAGRMAPTEEPVLDDDTNHADNPKGIIG